jgi:type I restriction-modification system DNA methylase subunit
MQGIFAGYRRGDAGQPVEAITEELFARWCAESQTVPMPRLLKEIADKFKTKSASVDDLKKLFKSRNFAQDAGAEVADALVSLYGNKKPSNAQLSEAMWRLYDIAADKLCAQTAHVLVGRILLYRIGEDSKVFPEKISGAALAQAVASAPASGTQFPALLLVDQMRADRESLLPTLYRLGEFDWWYIPLDKRSALSAASRAKVSALDAELDVAIHRTLSVLDRYQFEEVDVDVWRNVYQHYLPEEERQRLGGFYTPDELVGLLLDLIGYSPADKKLGKKLFIDPACGSGAFVVGALARLLKHFEKHDPPDLPQGKVPAWVRTEYELRAVQSCLHGIDLHPFASFLTNLNVLFLLLPKYMEVKKRNPSFTFEPFIVAHDSLLTTAAEAELTLLLQTQVNGRIERAAEDQKQYVELLSKEFDFVMGNPPWSGILKGPIAAVYDEQQKSRLRETFKNYATGKYDVYGLFMARAMRLLRAGGTFGLITQDTYFEKEWAKGLRHQLATRTSVRFLISLNPYGPLFFDAQNTPAITVADKGDPADEHRITVVMARRPIEGFQGLSTQARRTRVIELVRKSIEGLKAADKSEHEFVRAYRIEQARLRESARKRWNLAPDQKTGKHVGRSDWTAAADLLEVRQGVTPGGEGGLDIFLMAEERASEHALESDLLHAVAKGLEVEPYKCRKTGNVILYPYTINHRGRPTPAFDLSRWKEDQQGTIPHDLRVLPDALEIEQYADAQEKNWRKGHLLDGDLIGKVLQHRRAMGIVQYPNVAKYLLGHYDQLAGRVFEKKTMTELGKRWYEYHRPRSPLLMLAKPKIISPRLVERVTFALDSSGIVPQDSCIVLVKTAKRKLLWDRFAKSLRDLLGRNVTDLDVYKVLLAFLNSGAAQELLVTGRQPTPRGFYQITEVYLSDVQIPPLKNAKQIEKLIESVDILRTRSGDHDAAQAAIDEIVGAMTR